MKLSDRIREKKGLPDPAKPTSGASGQPAAETAKTATEEKLRDAALDEMFSQLAYLKVPKMQTAAEELAFFQKLVQGILDTASRSLNLRISQNSVIAIRKELLDIIVGFGPIETLIRDPGVSEIMING